MKIIIDTNFFLIPSRFKVDIFEEIARVADEYELCIIDKTIDELMDIINSRAKGKDKEAAKLGLLLIDKQRPHILSSEPGQQVDDAILEVKPPLMVATQDKQLKERLKEAGIPRIVLRQKNHLILQR